MDKQTLLTLVMCIKINWYTNNQAMFTYCILAFAFLQANNLAVNSFSQRMGAKGRKTSRQTPNSLAFGRYAKPEKKKMSKILIL